ncbi:HTH_Tnp_Tc3_2 domain-containing protein [Trichonephila clavipes]|nr:HTH_Tnp_Tc3_2 domain-containing protein [Trichonephila clavipes]
MTSRKRMEDSESWRAVGRIEAGQSITDVALFFVVHHSVISRSWKQFQTTQIVVRRPVGGRSRVTTPAEDRYIAIVAKWNRRVTSTRVTSMVRASIGKAIFAATVCPGTSILCSVGNMAIGLCLTASMSCLRMNQDLLCSQMTSV